MPVFHSHSSSIWVNFLPLPFLSATWPYYRPSQRAWRPSPFSNRWPRPVTPSTFSSPPRPPVSTAWSTPGPFCPPPSTAVPNSRESAPAPPASASPSGLSPPSHSPTSDSPTALSIPPIDVSSRSRARIDGRPRFTWILGPVCAEIQGLLQVSYVKCQCPLAGTVWYSSIRCLFA